MADVNSISATPVRRTFQAGVVAGMRSQLPLALLALDLRSETERQDRRWPLALLRSRPALPLLGLAAVGELVGDKLPTTPSRLSPAPFVGRLVFGGLAGAAMAARAGSDRAVGGGLGVAGAALGSVIFARIRTSLPRATGTPDLPWALVEDGLAIGLGRSSVHRGGL